MSEILISHAYFQILYRYMLQHELMHLLTAAESTHLARLAESNILEKKPLSELNHFLNILKQSEVSSQLYFDIAQNCELKHYGLVGYISSHAKTFLEAAQYIERYGTLIIDHTGGENIHLEQKAFESAVTWPLWNSDSIALNEINLFAIHLIIQQLFSQQNLKYQRIEIAHSATMPMHIYEHIFQCPVIMNASRYAFVYANHQLDTPLPQPDELLISLLSQQAEQWLQRNDAIKNTLTAQLEYIIQQHLEMGQTLPELETLAQSFHMSKRNFQRKLKQQGIIYRQLIERIKMKYCLSLLKQKQLSYTDIALQLGYADQSSLGRAFKKNHGYSLSQFQHQT